MQTVRAHVKRMAPIVAASGCTRRRPASECAVPLALEGVEAVSFELGNVEAAPIVLDGFMVVWLALAGAKVVSFAFGSVEAVICARCRHDCVTRTHWRHGRVARAR